MTNTKSGDSIALRVTDAIDMSGLWLDAHDRSRLGSFAIDRLALVYTHAMKSMHTSARADGVELDSDVLAWLKDMRSARITSLIDGELTHASMANLKEDIFAELGLWSLHDGDAAYHSDAIAVKTRFLSDVFDHPEFIDYYESGIHDTALIETLVAEGIDVEMARSL